MINNKSILNHRNKSLQLLSDFVAIQSVSTDKSRHKEIIKAVDFLKNEIQSLGFKVNIYQKNSCPPLIIANNYLNDGRPQDRKTIGVYAHYDVQPEDPLKKWDSPPFKLDLRNGKIFGRGVADDKGHIIQTLAAIRNLSKKLNNNIVLIFEGEEEVESKNFKYLVNQAKLEKIDVFYILDMGMKSKNVPQIYYGLRGIITGELTVRIGSSDLHSGVYGNRVLNPAQVIAELLAKIKDAKTNQVKIAGFYDQVKKISQKEIDILSEYVISVEEEKKNAGVKNFIGDFLSSKIQPSFEVNGMISGFTGQGGKTIIPSEATVKFSIRLVPDQEPKEIKKIVSNFIKNSFPKELDFELKIDDGCGPFYTDFKNLYAKKTVDILSKVFKSKTYFNRSGGSIGAAEVLQKLFAKPIILTGFTLPDENIHAPNENIDEEMFFKGIEALEKIFSQ